jgi:hypothetical protein
MHIDDTVAVALIAVGGTLGSGGLSYPASRANTDAQLEGVRLDILKLRKSQDEEARQERLTAYYEYLTAVQHLEHFYRGLSGEDTEEKYIETFNEFTTKHNLLLLIATEPVVEAAEAQWDAIRGVVGEIVKLHEAEPEKTPEENRHTAINESGASWKAAERDLKAAMREDTKRPFDGSISI